MTSGMRVVRDKAEMRDVRADLPRPLGFVPTMGALHEGHLALVRESACRTPATIVSMFVNPTQFSSTTDADRYPRDEVRDLALLEREQVAAVFVPSAEEMYPPGSVTHVEVRGGPAQGFEADARPGHFDGVATIVTKLLGIIQPDQLFLGEKDAQQLAVVRRMLRDLDSPVEVVPVPTVREPDGLAMSSRNRLIDPAERILAARLFAALLAGRRAAETAIDGSPLADLRERLPAPPADTITAAARAVLTADTEGRPPLAVDYVALVDPDSFLPLLRVDRPALLVAAVRLGGVRLIDNLPIDLAGPDHRPAGDPRHRPEVSR